MADPEADLNHAPTAQKTPWSSAGKPPLPRSTHPTSAPASCSTTTTTTFVTTHASVTSAVVPPKRVKRLPENSTTHTATVQKQPERAPKQLPKEGPPPTAPHHNRPPQASSYSDVASGLRSKANAQPHPPSKPPQSTPVPATANQSFPVQKPPGKTDQHQSPAEYPNAKADCKASESAPAMRPPHSVRQHHRSISDPLRAQPSPKRETDVSSSLDPGAIQHPPMSPPFSASHTSPSSFFSQEDESKSLPPASPLPVLPEAENSLSPVNTADMQDHHHPFSLSSAVRQLPVLPESPALECKAGQFGAIGAPLPTSAMGPPTHHLSYNPFHQQQQGLSVGAREGRPKKPPYCESTCPSVLYCSWCTVCSLHRWR